jgi:hypothetical protein
MRFLLLLALLIVAASAGCKGSGGSDESRRIEGLVLRIESADGFGEVESFTVKDGTEEFEIYIDQAITYDFPLAHLNAHRAGADPVLVEAESRDGRLVAISIGDA